MAEQTECKRCGTCCKKGGPALHTADLDLITSGFLLPEHLITIRRGELAHDPVSEKLQPVKSELIKISGAGGTWRCRFFDPKEKGCAIYEHRPLACRVLKCWDTSEIKELAGKDLLSRVDVAKNSEELIQAIQSHERLYPCPDFEAFARKLPRLSAKIIKKIEAMVNGDINFRREAIHSFHLSVDLEMFFFGRPLFQLFDAMGFCFKETKKGLRVRR